MLIFCSSVAFSLFNFSSLFFHSILFYGLFWIAHGVLILVSKSSDSPRVECCLVLCHVSRWGLLVGGVEGVLVFPVSTCVTWALEVFLENSLLSSAWYFRRRGVPGHVPLDVALPCCSGGASLGLGAPLHHQQHRGRDRLLCQLPGLVGRVSLTLFFSKCICSTGFLWAQGFVWSLQSTETQALARSLTSISPPRPELPSPSSSVHCSEFGPFLISDSSGFSFLSYELNSHLM